MTDTELRLMAAEYVEMCADGGGRFMTDVVNDAAKLSARLLELLPPADEGEPVTTEWLHSVGVFCGCFDPLCFGYHHAKKCFTLNIKSDLGSVSSIDVPTRGHVRRLCQALGITLTEPDRCHPSTGTR